MNDVEKFWSKHIVNEIEFRTPKLSLEYLNWRAEQYPKFMELMELYGNHKDEMILDYGCGPGNDLVGFLVYSSIKRIYGIDVSRKALELAQTRLNLHKIGKDYYLLCLVLDSIPEIPLVDGCVDYIYSEGVLHHTSHPQEILKEFYRVLKFGGECCIMVYNRDSIWYHLYVPYVLRLVRKQFLTLTDDEAFAKSTDSDECPISRNYAPEDFMLMCRMAGFKTEFKGGYYSDFELGIYRKYYELAKVADITQEHKDFLSELTLKDGFYPTYRGKYAGVGGVYKLIKE